MMTNPCLRTSLHLVPLVLFRSLYPLLLVLLLTVSQPRPQRPMLTSLKERFRRRPNGLGRFRLRQRNLVVVVVVFFVVRIFDKYNCCYRRAAFLVFFIFRLLDSWRSSFFSLSCTSSSRLINLNDVLILLRHFRRLEVERWLNFSASVYTSLQSICLRQATSAIFSPF